MSSGKIDSIEKYCFSNKKIVDCVTFYNEIDLLFYRLTILYNIVDYFIIVESNHTHTGKHKYLYYQKNKHLFKRFEDKIIHIIVDLPYIYPNINYDNNQWINENYQRNSIDQGIQQIQLNKTDLIVISDLDEIINPEALLKLKNSCVEIGFSLLQDMYYYNLNTKHTSTWNLSKIVTYEKYITTTPQQIRESKDLPNLINGGWHLSYFGNIEFIQNKLKNFAHQELNNNFYTDESHIKNSIKNNKDLFNRNYVPINYVPINTNTNLPPLYDKYLLNYVDGDNIPSPQTCPIYIYFHICCINNWKEIVSTLFFKIKNSGLYDLIKEIRCVILGDYDNSITEPKMNIIFQSPDIHLREQVTINLLYNDCINCKEEFQILYLHSKGVKHLNSKFQKNVYDWVEYLCYFNIYNFKLCLNELNTCDAIGVNLQLDIDNNTPLHYSGNFWWSKSSHIRNLTLIDNNYWNSPEFWVTSINGIYNSLWDSNTHHYNDPYPYYFYENKTINIRTHTLRETSLLA